MPDSLATASGTSAPLFGIDMRGEVKRPKKRKVLLMGKSGSGKSSMRSIIFSSYLARDTRRLGATIDIDLSQVKFLGNLTLNLWDCGGQEAFTENYLSQQRQHVFSHVGVLIYVFDIESRDVDRDLATYGSVISALAQYSPGAKVFVLIHKMDLIVANKREEVFEERVRLVRQKTAEYMRNNIVDAATAAAAAAASSANMISPVSASAGPQFGTGAAGAGMGTASIDGSSVGGADGAMAGTGAGAGAGAGVGAASLEDAAAAATAAATAAAVDDLRLTPFATSIWDQSLYKAWASIIHDLVPNLALIETNLGHLGRLLEAEEILLFERTSFLVVSHWNGDEGARNPFEDRFERMSNILKSFKSSLARYTSTPRNAEQFNLFELRFGLRCNVFIGKFTTNTYILVVLPPGEARFNAALLNTQIAAKQFEYLDVPVGVTRDYNQQQQSAGDSAHALGSSVYG